MMTIDPTLNAKREQARHALNEWEAALKAKLEETPRGSGHALNEFDHLKASITQLGSAKRVLWFD